MEKIYSSTFYHIYNRGNNGENLFYQDRNYRFFLKKLSFHLGDFLDLFAFVLMPNHFHLLVRIKGDVAIKSLTKNLTGLDELQFLDASIRGHDSEKQYGKREPNIKFPIS